MQRLQTIIALIVFICSGLTPTAGLAQKERPEILIINSYHKGYTWSDEVLNGIESTIYHSFPGARLHVEYMDTKRNASATYLRGLKNLYLQKYRKSSFDLIIASDDNGIRFVLDNRDVLFKDVPLVFCGANAFYTPYPLKRDSITGVLEYSDIKGTLELALKLQPDVSRVYVINDRTTTGKNVFEDLKKISSSLSRQLEFIDLEDAPLDLLEKKVADLPADSIVLLLAYLRDSNGTYYPPNQTASRLSAASTAPIYSVWDFFFNHGILGGVLTSGYLHGEVAAEMAIDILQGSYPGDLEVKNEGGNRLLIDFRQLTRHGITLDALPKKAIVKNITYSKQKNVLILLSYSATNSWNNSILQGLKEAFAAYDGNIQLFIEYMDTKRHTDKGYLHRLATVYEEKYRQEPIDLLIASDDNAFRFAMKNRKFLFSDPPIVFCGINYLDEPDKMIAENITGVMESYDIAGTIQLGLSLYPQTKKIFVINDQTTSGIANSKKLREAQQDFPEEITIVDSGPLSMAELLAKVSILDNETLILLMSFTTDRNNHRFSYKTSIDMIRSAANRPILGFWDFYVGHGITAGAITSGFDQGKMAGDISKSILSGKSVSSLPVVLKSPIKKIIDYRELERFPLVEKRFADDVILLNKPYSFIERNRKITYATLVLVSLLLLLILFQAVKIALQKRTQKELSNIAETDELTGAKNRHYLVKYLEGVIQTSCSTQTPLALCYLDIDNLKLVNDGFGHQVGDIYILSVVHAIRKHTRSKDVLARIGGDEFVLVLAGCEEQETARICSDINLELEKKKDEKNLQFSMSLSCGISMLDLNNPATPEHFLEQADKEMYQNKKHRKNERKM